MKKLLFMIIILFCIVSVYAGWVQSTKSNVVHFKFFYDSIGDSITSLTADYNVTINDTLRRIKQTYLVKDYDLYPQLTTLEKDKLNAIAKRLNAKIK